MGRGFLGKKISYSRFQSQVLEADVILSHRRFELTNFFIGGYYTHAGIVIGYGKIVEVTSKGVKETHWQDFLNHVDDFVILRKNNIENKDLIINKTLMEVGKKYNFTFIPNPITLNCSELVFKVFDLPSPNHLSNKVINKSFFSWFQQYSIHPEALLFHPDFEVIARLPDFLNLKNDKVDKNEASIINVQ